jgi:hypothetical protein
MKWNRANISRETVNSFLLALGYGIGLYLLMVFLHQRVMVDNLPDNRSLATWDAGWFKDIVDNGYVLKDRASNVGFCPLFPWIWKLSGLSAIGVSILNIVFFACGFAVFHSIYRFTSLDKFIILTTPSLYFICIPYSESLFISLTCVSFFGIATKRPVVTFCGLFFLALARPVAFILMPAFLAAEALANAPVNLLRSLWQGVLRYILPLTAGTAVLIWYQYIETGVWMAMFTQGKNWGHEFAWPILPFGSMYGPRLLWLDAVAMFLCTIALFRLMTGAINWLIRKKPLENKLLTVSYLYMVAVLAMTIFYNPVWGIDRTNVYDIHRYVFASPFFWVFLAEQLRRPAPRVADYLGVILPSNIFWLLFGSYAGLEEVLYYNFATLLMLLYMMYHSKRYSWVPAAIVAINIFIQVMMFQFFIGDNIYPG